MTSMPTRRTRPAPPPTAPADWSAEGWLTKPAAHQIAYDDDAAVSRAVTKLRDLPPLVTSWEVLRLRASLAEAEEGKRFLLQGGDCAEALADCRPEAITSKLKILLQMSLVLVHGRQTPVVRVGRFAGQYAKPRASPTETKTVDGNETTLPSYFGDLINQAPLEPDARRADPHLMVRAYQHSAMTLNFVRSLLDGGFADLHHPEYWDLSFLGSAQLSEDVRAQYELMSRELSSALRFMEALGEKTVDELTRVEFFASHEGLNLQYESAQTRRVPHAEGHWCLTTHLPWIGERTRQLGGAHVEFFRGIENPVGVKVGPSATADEVVELARALNPANIAGKLVLITRVGSGKAAEIMPAWIDAVRDAGVRCLWTSDPMHGNTITTDSGVKTRPFDRIMQELEEVIDAHEQCGSRLGGMHVELTGEDVTECVGGATDIREDQLHENYASACAPRLNYQQSLELAFIIAKRLGKH